VELVKLLLERGVDVNTTAQSKERNTPLHLGALQGGFEVVRLLLEHGANPNLLNAAGDTPLHAAIAGDEEIEVVKALVEGGARLDIPNQDGMTPVRVTARRGRSGRAIYTWLVEKAGGKEPAPKRTAGEMRPLQEILTKDLIASLSLRPDDKWAAAQRELIARGGKIMPDALHRLDQGGDIEPILTVLAAIGPEAEPALPKLESLLASRQYGRSAFMTMEGLKPGCFQQLPRETREHAANVLFSAITGSRDDPMLTDHSIRTLVRMGDCGAECILKLLESNDPHLRRIAADVVKSAEYSHASITTKLVSLATADQDRSVRLESLRSLGKYGETRIEVKHALLAQFQHPPVLNRGSPEPEQRAMRAWQETAEAAAYSLRRFGPGIIDDLLPMLTPLENPRRKAAITALAGLGGEAVPRLVAMLSDNDRAVAISASIALERIGSPAAPALIDALDAGDDRQIGAVAGILARVKPRTGSVSLKLLAVAADDQRSDVTRITAGYAALNIDARNRDAKEVIAIVPVIVRVLEKGSFREQGLAAETAGMIGPAATEALPMLRQRMQLPDENVNTEGIVRDYVRQRARQAISAIEKEPAVAQP
jgi:HEAT repeat protein